MIIGIETLAEARARTIAAAKNSFQGIHAFEGRRLSFATLDLLWRTLSPKRLDLLQVMIGGEAMSIREVARRLGRDVKAVHGDVQALLERDILRKTDDGRVAFPYDEIRLNVVIAPREADAA